MINIPATLLALSVSIPWVSAAPASIPPQDIFKLDPSCKFEIGKNTSCTMEYTLHGNRNIWVQVEAEDEEREELKHYSVWPFGYTSEQYGYGRHLVKGTGSFPIRLDADNKFFTEHKKFRIQVILNQEEEDAVDPVTGEIHHVQYPDIKFPLTIN